MRRRILWIAGTLAAISVASTTAEQCAEASKRLARWNPLFIGLTIAMLILIFRPWG